MEQFLLVGVWLVISINQRCVLLSPFDRARNIFGSIFFISKESLNNGHYIMSESCICVPLSNGE